MSILSYGLRLLPLGAMCATLTLSCGDEQDDAGANDLWERMQADDYRTFQTAPGYDTPQPTIRAHGQTATVYMNSTMAAAIEGEPISEWPEGSLLIKDSFEGDSLALIAAMEKQPGGWFFAEWEGDGSLKFAGSPDVCVSCHEAGDDFVLTVPLP